MKIPARMTRQGKTVPAFEVDECFASQVNQFKWYVSGTGYLRNDTIHPNTKLHQYVWELSGREKPEYGIDHINGDVLDNRLENLRAANHLLNMKNSRRRNKKRDLPRGVNLLVAPRQKSVRYRADINHRGRKHFLGSYDTPEAASSVYENAKEMLIEFAALPSYKDCVLAVWKRNFGVTK